MKAVGNEPSKRHLHFHAAGEAQLRTSSLSLNSLNWVDEKFASALIGVK